MRLAFYLIIASILFQSCSSDSSSDSNTTLLETRTFTFTAAIDPSTLTQQQSIIISHVSSTLNTSTFIYTDPITISTSTELDALNSTVVNDEQQYIVQTFADLGSYTYFLIPAPYCPEYLEYAGSSYNNGHLSITVNHFIDRGVLCPANAISLLDGYYDVYRANKI